MRSTPFIIDIKRLKISDPPFLLKLHIKIEKEIIAIQQI